MRVVKCKYFDSQKKLDSFIRTSVTIFYSLLYFKSRPGFDELKCLYLVISVIDKRLSGNIQKQAIAPFVDDHISSILGAEYKMNRSFLVLSTSSCSAWHSCNEWIPSENDQMPVHKTRPVRIPYQGSWYVIPSQGLLKLKSPIWVPVPVQQNGYGIVRAAAEATGKRAHQYWIASWTLRSGTEGGIYTCNWKDSSCSQL